MKLVYVAGPYRAATAWGIECNIQQARDRGAEVVRAGAYPVIPHSNTSHFDGLAPDAFWLDGTLELMRRCDAVLMCGNWERSSGARAEVAEATRLKLPVFYTLTALGNWLYDQEHAEEVERVFAADDDARERAIERAVDEHLDREQERRHG